MLELRKSFRGIIRHYIAGYSPSLIGMAESVVGKFKRDYRCSDVGQSAGEVITMLPDWFDRRISYAPHLVLQMLCLKEFIEKDTRVN